MYIKTTGGFNNDVSCSFDPLRDLDIAHDELRLKDAKTVNKLLKEIDINNLNQKRRAEYVGFNFIIITYNLIISLIFLIFRIYY